MTKSLSGFLGFLFLSCFATAQDVHFSQFYENSILRNPALTGIFSGDYKAGINYRRQWGSISNPFQTALLSLESKIKVNEVNDYFSFGLSTMYDRAGSTGFNSMYLYPAINYNKAIEDAHLSYVSVGVTLGYILRTVNSVQMIFGDQFANGYYSPNNISAENINNTKVQYFDLGAGVSFNSTLGERRRINYYLGAGAYHVNRPKIEFNNDDPYLRLPVKWSGNLGMQWMVEEHAVLSIHGNYSKEGPNQEVITGFLASYRAIDFNKKKTAAIYAGAFYRWGDSWIPTLKVDYKTFSFTVSYDATISQLTPANKGQGGYEFSIFTKGFFNKGVFATDKTKCPRFEEMLETEY